jgi:Domain of unknown function (DUF6438)
LLAGFGITPAPGTRGQKELPKDTLITLERTACFGRCPIYKVSIFADGTVKFEGRQFVKVKGTARSSITEERLRRLIGEFDKINYFNLHDRYLSASDGCPAIVTDMPSVNTSIQINGRKKSISHYHGCWDRNTPAKVFPPELVALENKIDEIVETGKWIK